MSRKLAQIKLAWVCLTDRSFIFWLGQVLKYAIRNYNDHRGEDATDVLLFNGRYGDIIMNWQQERKIK